MRADSMRDTRPAAMIVTSPATGERTHVRTTMEGIDATCELPPAPPLSGARWNEHDGGYGPCPWSGAPAPAAAGDRTQPCPARCLSSRAGPLPQAAPVPPATRPRPPPGRRPPAWVTPEPAGGRPRR